MLAIALLTPRSHKYSIYQRVKSIRLDSSERPVAIRDVRDIIYLTDDTTSYFIKPASGSTRCFIAGTDWNQTSKAGSSQLHLQPPTKLIRNCRNL